MSSAGDCGGVVLVKRETGGGGGPGGTIARVDAAAHVISRGAQLTECSSASGARAARAAARSARAAVAALASTSLSCSMTHVLPVRDAAPSSAPAAACAEV